MVVVVIEVAVVEQKACLRPCNHGLRQEMGCVLVLWQQQVWVWDPATWLQQVDLLVGDGALAGPCQAAKMG